MKDYLEVKQNPAGQWEVWGEGKRLTTLDTEDEAREVRESIAYMTLYGKTLDSLTAFIGMEAARVGAETARDQARLI